MPLLLFNLDNTLVDRAGAFRAWAEEFLTELGAPVGDVDWLVDTDADGLTSPWDVAEAVKARYALSEPVIALKQAVQEGLVAFIRADPLIACALRIATNAGWVPLIVSNGDTQIQEAKIKRAALDRYVDGWVISDEAGVSKPNPRIFEIAAHRARARLTAGWVVGDGPETDIGGAAELRLPSVWLHRGRAWSRQRVTPTRTADSVIGAVAAILDAVRGPESRPPGPEPRLPGPRALESRSPQPRALESRSLESRSPESRSPEPASTGARRVGRAQPRSPQPYPPGSRRGDPYRGEPYPDRDGPYRGEPYPDRDGPYRGEPYPDRDGPYRGEPYRDHPLAVYPQFPVPHSPVPQSPVPQSPVPHSPVPRSPVPRLPAQRVPVQGMPVQGVASVNARYR